MAVLHYALLRVGKCSLSWEPMNELCLARSCVFCCAFKFGRPCCTTGSVNIGIIIIFFILKANQDNSLM
ncbi:hypothetical protein HanPI659440_Chr11g0421141 [Helianthus annuus]|nr:hypothetical protein HanPI659440_Chr11g0421141 [Helianthus annuus]